jgi:hypothetical protein
MLEIRAAFKPQQYKLASTAVCLLAVMETPGTGAYQDELGRMAQDLMFMRHPQHHLFRSGFEEGLSEASLPNQALGAAALTQWFKLNRNPAAQNAANSTLTALWDQIDTSREAARAMPWLAYAELWLTELGAINPRLTRLKEALEQSLAGQVGRDGRDAPPDTVGGLDSGADLIFNAPSWRTAQVLTGLSVALESGHLIDDQDTPRWLLQCGLAGRYLSQLTMQTHDCYYTMSPNHAIGAVRSSLHNNRQPLEATATALLALVEFRHAINRLSEAGEVKD